MQQSGIYPGTLIKGVMISLIVTLVLLFLFVWNLSENAIYYKTEITTIIICNLLVMLMYSYTVAREKFDIFHTIHLVTILYLITFVYTPLSLINAGKADCYGVDVMPGCIPATIIFTYSYLAYVIGYSRVGSKVNFTYTPVNPRLIPTVLKFAWILWILAFMLSLVYLFKTGRSLAYILTLGTGGEKSDETTDLLFLSNFTLCMIVPLIYLFKYQKNKLLFLIPLFLTFAIFYIRGFRIFIMIMIVGLFLFYFKSKAKKPSLQMVGVFLAAMLVLNTIVGGARNSLRTGEDTELTVEGDDILYTLESNFDIYKPFYGLVMKYPSVYDFTLGQSTIIDTIAMWVPRSIWSGKPLPEDTAVPLGIRHSTSDFSIFGAAMSWPNIAEFYMDYGPIGTAVVFFLFGIVSKKMIQLYYSPNINHLVLYSVSFTLLLQFVIRGSFSLFLPFVVFTLIPYYVIKKYALKPQ